MTAHVTVSTTPNENALKFEVNKKLLESGYKTFNSAEEAKDFPLAANLFAIDGVVSVFVMAQPGTSFITVTKDPEADWAQMQNQIVACIQAGI